jgi:hypothetical protein
MDKIEEMLGYKPDREIRVALLKAVKEEGKPLAQVIAEGLIVLILPYIAIMEDNDTFWDMKTQRHYTLEEWYELNPLGRYCKVVVIRGPQKEDIIK